MASRWLSDKNVSFPHTEARVGLEQTFFNVIESVGVVEVCAIITFPSINCPVEFPFDVGLSTEDGTAGKTLSTVKHIRLQVAPNSYSVLTHF